MRVFEALLSCANLLTFVILSIRSLHTAQWMRHLTFIALMIAFLQGLIEGPRWQMMPAYALTVLFLVISTRATSVSAVVPAGWTVARKMVIGAGALGLAIGVALPMIFPVFSFRNPTGPYAIGTLTYHWIDTARAEVFSADPQLRWQLMVQVWYPAQASPSVPRAAYMSDAGAIMSAFARIHGKPAFVFDHFRYITTNAVTSAAAAGDQLRYPVLLFLEGATGFRQMNTFQVEELVSHGYIVAAIDQPGAAANVVFPDGHQSVGLNLAQFQATVRPSYMPELHNSARRGGMLMVPYLTKDVGFTLDQLVVLDQSDPSGILTGRLDMGSVGVFGVSLGGIVAGEVCRVEPRVRACLAMDAPMSIDVVKAGLRQPTMWITRDAGSMRLERQRAGGWPNAEILAHQTSMRAVYESLSGAGYFVQVPGMFHSNFTDTPAWSPFAAWLGLAGPIEAQRAHDIVNAYTVAFFDRHLRGRSTRLLDGPADQFPEVLFESRRPRS